MLPLTAILLAPPNTNATTWFALEMVDFFKELPSSLNDILYLEIASPCSFDEGTPLVQVYKDGINRIAVGIMSKFAPNCAAPSPSIYTRLSAYYAWLLKTAGQQPAPTA